MSFYIVESSVPVPLGVLKFPQPVNDLGNFNSEDAILARKPQDITSLFVKNQLLILGYSSL